MREIKFRAWHTAQKEMVNDFLVWWNNQWIQKPTTILGTTVLMQWTGLLDRNKKEIYEGDIINEYDCNCGRPEKLQNLLQTGRVEWMPFGWVDCAYALIYNDRSNRILQGDDEPHYEVIGNIWENGDLLKEQDE